MSNKSYTKSSGEDLRDTTNVDLNLWGYHLNRTSFDADTINNDKSRRYGTMKHKNELDFKTTKQVKEDIKRLGLLPHLAALAEEASRQRFRVRRGHYPPPPLTPNPTMSSLTENGSNVNNYHMLDNKQQRDYYHLLKTSVKHRDLLCDCCYKRHQQNKKLKVTPHLLGIWYIYGCESCPTITSNIKVINWVKTYYDKLNRYVSDDEKIVYKLFKFTVSKNYAIKIEGCKNIIWKKFQYFKLFDNTSQDTTGKFHQFNLLQHRNHGGDSGKRIPNVYMNASNFNKLLLILGMCQPTMNNYYEIPIINETIIRLLTDCAITFKKFDGKIHFQSTSEFQKVINSKTKLLI